MPYPVSENSNCGRLDVQNVITGRSVEGSNHVKRLSREYSPTERAAMFHDTAVRVYSVDES